MKKSSRISAIGEALAKAVSKIPPQAIAEAEEIMKRLRAADKLPKGHQKRVIWERLWETTPAFLAPIWRHLPDPLKSRGRPKGRGVVIEDAKLFAEIDRRATRPEDIPNIVRSLVPEDHPWRKNRVDHIVKEYRKRGKK